MSKLWVIEALTGPNNSPVGKWVPLWCAFDQCSGPTRRECLEALEDQPNTAAMYLREGTYTKFRVAKYVRAE